MVLTINGTEYRVKFSYNCFCDNDIFDRVKEMLGVMNGTDAGDDNATALGRIRDLFKVTRDLLFIGFKKYNPVATAEEVGNLLDDYHEEAPEGEDRSVLHIFLELAEELMSEGFLSELNAATNQPQKPKPKVAKKK